jgi:hypothetical protein
LKTGFAFLVLALAAAIPCLASPFYEGSDTACFYPVSDTTCTLVSTKSTLGVNLAGKPLISYSPDVVDFTAPETGGTVELGAFHVATSLLAIEDGTFDLQVTFSLPGGGGQTYTASTFGLVVLGLLGAEVSFQQPVTQLYRYPGGAFDLTLPDSPILIGNGKTVILDATITPVPEPASLPVVAGGLLVLGFALTRRNVKLARS